MSRRVGEEAQGLVIYSQPRLCSHFLTFTHYCAIKYFIMAAETLRADFQKVFPSLVKDVSDLAKRYNLPTNALEWFQKVGLVAIDPVCQYPD